MRPSLAKCTIGHEHSGKILNMKITFSTIITIFDELVFDKLIKDSCANMKLRCWSVGWKIETSTVKTIHHYFFVMHIKEITSQEEKGVNI